MSIANPKSRSHELGTLLRHWRDQRGKSQLDLSFDAGVSQRHISFIESGRSVPTRQMLLGIAQALDVPFRERNLLLLAAGYAPAYAEHPWDAPEMQMITGALTRMLHQHEPYPAVALDRDWNVLLSNASAPTFFDLFIDMSARPTPRNFLHLMFDPAGMRPFITNWEDVAQGLLERVHREAVGQVVNEDLVATLLAYPDVKREWQVPRPQSAMPVLPLSFTKDGVVLQYFSMVATVGIPRTVAAQELRLDFIFPADEDTDARHRDLMTGAS